MIYIWVSPNCPNKFIAALDREISPDRFLLLRGNRIAEGQVNNKFVFNLKVKQAEITIYDDIPNNANMPLVNQKIRDILQEETPNEVQFFDAEIHCKDGMLTNYKLLNVTSTIKGIDYEKSIIEKMKLADAILGFKYLTYKPGCMGNYKLARDAEYLSNLLVSEGLKQKFMQAKIKGARFVRPEEWYGPMSRI